MTKPEFQKQVLFQLYRTWATANPMFLRLGEGRFTITRREWRVLATLVHFECLRSSELAQAAELDVARTSKTVTRLVEKGWVSRHKNKTNARSVLIQIEPAGQQLYKNMMPLIVEMNQMLTQDVSPQEMAVFTSVLDKIMFRAKEMNAAQIIPEKVRGPKAPKLKHCYNDIK